MLADSLGVDYPLEEFMAKFTHREYRTRLAWLRAQYNQPSRTDYYLMQIAGYVKASAGSKRSWKPSDFKILFDVGDQITTRSEKIKQDKARWRQRTSPSKRQQYGRHR
jgi:hypothetical protein